MAGDTPPPSGTNGPAGSRDKELAKRLHDLGDRLAVAEKASRSSSEDGGAGGKVDASSLASAMRLAGEFVSGVVVGAALGWGVDQLFGTKPWGLMVLLLLGFVAGVLNVMRAAGFVRSGSKNKRS